MRYKVLAQRWNNEQEILEWVVIAQFDKYLNAEIFRMAYEKRFKSSTPIFDREILK